MDNSNFMDKFDTFMRHASGPVFPIYPYILAENKMQLPYISLYFFIELFLLKWI